MIYDSPTPDSPIDQGDLIDECPWPVITNYAPQSPDAAQVQLEHLRVVVMTQTCDLANSKALSVVVARVFEAEKLIDMQIVKAAEVRGPIRAIRVWGYYFLPAAADLGLPEMIVDLRLLHTVGIDTLQNLCVAGNRRGRIQPLYREHLAKHFADTYSRIGLPRPYETM